MLIVQGLLRAAYLAAPLIRRRSRGEKPASTVGRVEDFPPSAVKAIEAIGAVGLILPWATGTAEVLTPLATAGFVIVHILAAGMHPGAASTKTFRST